MSYTVDQINAKSGLKNCYTCLNSTKGSFYWSDTADGGKGKCSTTKTDDSFYNKSDSRYKNCDKPNMHSVYSINNSEKLRNCYTCLNSGVTEDGYWWSDNKGLCSTSQTDSTYYNKVSTDTPYTTTSCAKPSNYDYSIFECSTSNDCKKTKSGQNGKCLFNGDFDNPIQKCYFPCSLNSDCTETGEKCITGPGVSSDNYCRVPISYSDSGNRICKKTTDCNSGEICKPGWNGVSLCVSNRGSGSGSSSGSSSGDASWYDNYNNQLEQNQELVEKLLDDIQQLQDLEKSLLDTLDTNTNLTSDERITLLEKINSISDMRTNLYSALNNINGYYDSLNSATSSSMSDQSSAIKIIEEQLNKTKMSLMDYETDKNNKLRLIEVNSYYSQRYSEHAKIMKILIYTLAPIILLSIISNAGLIPYNVFILLFIIISVYGGVLFFNTLLSIWSRDSINYQQYLWSFNKESAPAPVVNDGTNSNPWGFPNLGTCVGADCCSSDTYYDSESDTCKKNTN